MSSSPTLASRLKGRSELGVALLLGAVGVIVLVDALALVTPYSQSDPVGPKTLPFIVAAVLLVCSVLLAINVLRGGLTNVVAELKGIEVAGVEVAGGVNDAIIKLPAPRGTVGAGAATRDGCGAARDG